MSATVDQRIVEMKFDNQQFESGVKDTLGTLDKLKKALNFDNLQANAFENINKAANKVDLNSISDQLETISKRFSLWGIAEATVVHNLTNSVVDYWKKTISQIREGGRARAANLEQAKFQLKGLGIAWDEVSDDINYGVQETAYGLDSAAKAASQLSASGVQLGTDMKAALRGISGVAAMTNSEYDEIAHIFTTVAGNGRLMGMQLTQLSSKGINAAATLAEQMGVTESAVREMVTKGQISFDMFSKAMDNAFGEHAKDANSTFTGSLSNMKAALSRIGADFQTPFRDKMIPVFNSLKSAINAVHKALTPLINGYASFVAAVSGKTVIFVDKLTAFLTHNTELGTWKDLLDGIANTLMFVLDFLKPISSAFSEVFSIKNDKAVKTWAESFKNWTKNFKLSSSALEAVKRIFTTLFYTMKQLANAFIWVTGAVSPLIRPMITLLELFLKFVAANSKLIVSLMVLHKTITTVSRVTSVFRLALSSPLTVIMALAAGIGLLIYYLSQLKVVQEAVIFGIQKIATVYSSVASKISVLRSAISSLLVSIKNGAGILGKIYLTFKQLTQSTSAFIKNSNILTSFFLSLKNVAVHPIQSLTNLIARIKEFTSSIHGFTDLKSVIQSISSTFSKWGNSFVSFLKEGINGIQLLLGFGKQATPVVDKTFKTVVVGNELATTAMTGFEKQTRTTRTAIDIFKDKLASLKDSFKVTSDNIKNSTIVKTLSSIISKIKEFAIIVVDELSKISIGQYIVMAFSGAFILLILQIGRAIQAVGELVSGFAGLGKAVTDSVTSIGKSITGVFNAISTGITGISQEIKETIAAYKKSFQANNMLKIAAAMAILAASCALLAWTAEKVNWPNLIAGAAAISILAIALGALSWVLSRAQFEKVVVDFRNLAIAIGVLAASALAIVAAINLLKIDETTFSKVGTLIIMLTTLSALAAGMSIFAPRLFTGASSLLFFATSTIILAKAFNTLATPTKIAQWGEKIKAFAAMAATMSVAVIAISKFAPKVSSSGFKLILMSVGLLSFAKALQIIGNMDFSGLAAKIEDNKIAFAAIIGGVLVMFALYVSAMKSSDSMLHGGVRGGIGDALLKISASLVILVAVVKLIDKIDIGTLLKGGAVIAAAMFMIATFTNSIDTITNGNEFHKFARGLIPLSVAIIALTAVAHSIKNLEDADLIKGIKFLGVCFAGFAGLAAVSGRTKDASFAGMMGIVIGISALVFEMTILTLMPLDKVLKASVAIGLIIAAFGYAVGQVTKNKFDVKTVIPLLSMAAVLAGFAYELYLLNGYDWKQITATGISMGIAIAAFGKSVSFLNDIKINKSTRKETLLMIPVFLSLAGGLYLISKNDWKSIAAAGGAISVAMLAFGGAIRVINGIKVNKSATEAMLQLILPMVMIGLTMAVIAMQPWSSIAASGPAMAAAMLSFAASFKILDNVKLSKTVTSNLAKMIPSMIVIAAGLWVISQNNWASIAASGFAMSSAMLSFASAMKILDSITIDPKTIRNLFFAALALEPLAIELTFISRLGGTWENIISSGLAMAAAMVSFGYALHVISSIQDINLETIGLMTIASIALVPLFMELGILSKLCDGTTLVAASEAMAISMLSFAGALSAVSRTSFSLSSIAQMFVATLLVHPLMEEIKSLSTYDWGSLIGASVSLGIALLGFASAMVLVSKASSDVAGALIGIVAMAAFSLILKTTLIPSLLEIQNVDFLAALGGALGLAAVMTVLVGAARLAQEALVGVVGLIGIGAALLIIAPSLQKLADIDAGALAASAGSMLLVFGALLVASAVVSFLPELIIGIAALAVGMLALGKALEMMGPAIDIMNDADLIKIAGGLSLLGLAGIPMGIGGPAMLMGAPGVIAMGIALNIFAPAARMLDGLDLVMMGLGLAACGAGGAVLGAAGLAMGAGALGVAAMGLALIPFSHGLEVAMAAIEKAVDLLSTFSPAKMAEAGAFTVKGFISGITSNISSVISVAQSMATSFLESFNATMGIASPSVKMIQAALYTWFGFCEGTVQAEPEVAAYAARMAQDGVVNVFKEEIAESLPDVTNVITDWADNLTGNITSQFDGMFDGIFDGMSSLNKRLGFKMEDGKMYKWGIDEETGKAGWMLEDYASSLGIASDALDSFGGAAETAGKKTGGSSKATKEATETTKDYGTIVDWAGKEIIEYYNNMLSTNRATGDLTVDTITAQATIWHFAEQIYNASAALKDEKNSFDESAESAKDHTIAVTEAFLEYKKNIQESVESSINIFSKFEKKTEMTKDTLLENMRSQLEGVREYYGNIASLSEKGILDQAMLDKLVQMGASNGFEIVNAMMQASDSELQEMQAMFSESLVLPESTATMLIASFAQAGQDAALGLINAVDAQGQPLDASGQEMANNFLNGFKAVSGWASPWTTTIQAGQDSVTGLIQGIGSLANRLFAYASNVARETVNRFKLYLNRERGEYLGRQMIEGIIQGLKDGESKLTEVAREIAKSAYEAACDELEVESPSKKMREVGRFYDLGFVKGIEDYSNKISDTAKELARTAMDSFSSETDLNPLDLGDDLNISSRSINSFNEAIGRMFDLISGNVDTDPVIRPVLDLSNVEAGAQKINQLFANRRVSVNGEGSKLTGEENQNGSTFNFTQNNYSPKALSREEIYRQTKSQFSMLKGLVGV